MDMHAVMAALMDGLLPPQCAGCGLATFGRHPLCPACARVQARAPGHLAACCGKGLMACGRYGGESGEGERRRGSKEVTWHRRCAGLDDAMAAWLYQGPWPHVVARMKRTGSRRLAQAVGACMAQDRRISAWCDAPDLLFVPVPPWPARLFQRAADPVGSILNGFGRRPTHALRRTHVFGRQVGRSRLRRKDCARSMFASTRLGADLAGKRVVLLDDVITTGATISAAAEVLRKAGAAWVGGLFAFRAPAARYEDA